MTLFSLSNSNLAGSHLRASGNTYVGSEGRVVSAKELGSLTESVGAGERLDGAKYVEPLPRSPLAEEDLGILHRNHFYHLQGASLENELGTGSVGAKDFLGYEEEDCERKVTTTSTLEGGGIFASGARLERETREVMSSPNIGGALARGLLSEDGAESTSSCESFRALREYPGVESDARESARVLEEFDRRTPTPAGSVVSRMSATQRKEWAAKLTAGFCKENVNPFRRDFSSCNSNSVSQASLPLSKLSARGTERRWERELDAELQRREDEREREQARANERFIR